MREVGPSRKILHARGVGLERRKPVKRRSGSWGALGATRKIKITIYELHVWPLQGPLFLGPGMQRTSTILIFVNFKKIVSRPSVFRTPLFIYHSDWGAQDRSFCALYGPCLCYLCSPPARPPARPSVRPQEKEISLYILPPPDRPHLMRPLVI